MNSVKGIWKILLSPSDECGLFPIVARIGVYGFLLFGILFIQSSHFDADELLTVVSFTSIVVIVETMWRKSEVGKKVFWHLLALFLLICFLSLLLNQAVEVRESWHRTHILEERIEELVATAPTAVIVSDGLGNIKYVNKHTTNLIGWTNDEIKNKPLSILIRPSKLKAHNMAFNKAVKDLKEGTAAWVYTGDHIFRVICKDNNLVKVQVYILGMRYSSNDGVSEYPPGRDVEFYAIMQPVKPLLDLEEIFYKK